MNHNKDQNTFEIKSENYTSVLNYQLDPDLKTMNINRTFVPDELRGQGLAGKLNKAALDYAAENSLRVVPLCSYTAAYIERHAEYKKLLKIKSKVL